MSKEEGVYKLYKKILLIVAVLIILILSYFYFINDSGSQNALEETEMDNPLIDNGFGLDVTNMNSNDNTKENGVINITDLNDVINVEVSNIGRDRELILKLFYDYEEIDFKVQGETSFQKEYIFNLSDTSSITLPIQLPETIQKDNLTHKLLVSLYPSPNVHEKDAKARTSTANLVLNYDIVYDQGKQNIYSQQEQKTRDKQKYEIPEEIFEAQYIGLVINEDWDWENEGRKQRYVKYPPYNLKAEKNQDLTLSFTAGGFPDTSEYLILLTVGWEQWEMDGEPYKPLQIEPSKLGYGTFQIKTPAEHGLYEVVAYLINNPFDSNNSNSFLPVMSSYRFTLEVE